MIDIGSPDGQGIDLVQLEQTLSEYAASFEKSRKAAFVVLSYGEVNTVRIHDYMRVCFLIVTRESLRQIPSPCESYVTSTTRGYTLMEVIK